MIFYGRTTVHNFSLLQNQQKLFFKQVALSNNEVISKIFSN